MIKTTYEKQKNALNRRNFAKIGGTFSLPNLIEIQTASFEWFLKTGLNEVFEDIHGLYRGGRAPGRQRGGAALQGDAPLRFERHGAHPQGQGGRGLDRGPPAYGPGGGGL